MQHAARQAIFGINVIEKYRDANLADPAIQKDLETMLRQFGYQFTGHSNVKIGGLDWLLYPVRAGSGTQQVTGIIRYASAGGYVFGITMLRGGGQEAAQDAELQQAAASFRVLPAAVIAIAAPLAPAQDTGPGRNAPTPPASATKTANKVADKTSSDAEEPSGGDDSKLRLVWYAAGGLFVLAMFFGIIGTGRSQKR